ncbi:ankyrin repeat-containing domain protein [Xylariomycetidae sp. FL0641]|nr:ankyrin repeat-containing domain protein [Xylariomycetidae sp. FL0641]
MSRIPTLPKMLDIAYGNSGDEAVGDISDLALLMSMMRGNDHLTTCLRSRLGRSPVFVDLDGRLRSLYFQECKQGNTQAVELLLGSLQAPDFSQAPYETGLLLALQYRHVEVAELLLRASRNSPPDAQFAKSSLTHALLLASYLGHLTMMRDLIASGADVNGSNELPHSLQCEKKYRRSVANTTLQPAVAAILSGSIEILTFLLDAGVDPNGRPEERVPSLLAWAVTTRHPPIIRLLIGRGAIPSFKTIDNRDLCSCCRGMTTGQQPADLLTVAQLLLAAGADINGHNICTHPSQERGDYPETSMTWLQQAVKDKDFNLVKFLLEKGAMHDAYNPRRLYFTPLQLAISHSNWEIAELLIRAGADESLIFMVPDWPAGIPNDPNIWEALLQRAAVSGSLKDLFHGLAVCGANLEVHCYSDIGGLLEQALRSRSESSAGVVRFLLKNGHRPDSYQYPRDAKRGSSLQKATSPFLLGEDLMLAKVKLLISHGAKVNVTSRIGSPLSRAAACSHSAVVEYLLSKGANPNLGNAEKREFPVEIAFDRRDFDSVEVLLRYGAEIHDDFWASKQLKAIRKLQEDQEDQEDEDSD